jgi:hypothetical protein
MDPALAQTHMTIHARVVGAFHDTYEGEAKMSQEQLDQYKNIIGDGQGRVTVGRDMAEKDFGNGGGVFVNVSLACDQSTAGIYDATRLAYQIADQYCGYYFDQVRQDLVKRGMVKPR